jgi:hypothetical protein
MKKQNYVSFLFLMLVFCIVSINADTLFVDGNVSGNNNGSDWANAYNSLQDALENAVSGDEIWVAKGTYLPTEETDGTTDTQRKYSFMMVDGVSIYGGFAGTETAVSQRTDYSYGGVNETILSGDFNGDDVITGEGGTLSITGNTENAYHVIYHPAGYTLTNTALLDGFTITGGNANGSANPWDDGGGIYNSDGQTPTINYCYFIGNEAGDNGGAIQNADNASPISITNCAFKQNKAGDSGGGITFLRGPGTVTNCFFSGNKATNDFGGAVYVWQSSANVDFINSTMTENNARSGGAIHINEHAEGTIINCIAYGNTITTGEGPQIRVFDNSTANISYTDIEGGIGTGATANSTSTINDNGNNIVSDPLFVGSTLNPQHPYALLGTSPCVDAGDNTANSEINDIRGNGFERKLDKTDGSSGTIDIGAYEYNFYEDLFDQDIIFVNDDATGNNSGINWRHAYTSFQTALETASSGQQIWVAKGIYKPSKETDGTTDTPAEFAFQMVDGVEIFGGFSGTEADISARMDYKIGGANETILSGDLNGDDIVTGSGSNLSFSYRADNTYQVFQHPNDYVLSSSTILDGFTIKGAHNTDNYGGGIMLRSGAEPSIQNCIFTENYARWGGGVGSYRGVINISNCVFAKNQATSQGGGIYNNSTTSLEPASISNSEFFGNKTVQGGGIYNYNGGEAQIENCLLYENYATKGGGITIAVSQASIINTTITDNVASSIGGGLSTYLTSDGSYTLKNAIIWNNTAGSSGDEIKNEREFSFTISYSDIKESGGSGVSWDATIGVDGDNNIDFEPYFVGTNENPDHPYSIFGNSPCVDAGDNTANSQTYDIRGSGFDRKLDGTNGSAGTIDMGAYEYKYGTDPVAPSLLYVDVDASGGNSGISWTDAFTSFQDALDIAVSGSEIWVAAGTYKPSKETDGTTDNPELFAFQMIEGVEIYGGFAGTESIVSERTNYGLGEANETILSGDLNGNDLVTGSGASLSFSNTSDNTYQVFKHPNNYTLTSSAVLDGFTIKGAHNTTLYGGGILNSFGAEPAIRNCVFTENFAKFGGGIASSNSSPNVLNCTFTRNKASFDGGALYVLSSASSGVVSGLKIYGNYAGNGGGIFSSTSSEQYFNCLIYDNASQYDGAGVYISNGSPALVNLTITMNEAGRNGGGIFTVLTVQTPELANSIVWGNGASTGDDIHHHNDKLLGISYSNIKNSGGSDSWNSDFGTDGGNNIDENPQFVGITVNPEHPYSIYGFSPCVDAGDDSANSQTYDIRGFGFERKLNSADGSTGTIDIGAYEYKFGVDPASPSVGNLYISEVSDNKPSKAAENTGFIEIWNNTGSDVSLNGYSILQGTNNDGFAAGSYSYLIPNGYTIPVDGFFVIGNGADLATFNTAWSLSLTAEQYDNGHTDLDFTNGHAYALDDGTRAIIDETVQVNENARIYQQSAGTWVEETPSTSTPGGFGDDAPLPVTLSSFTGIYANGSSLLQWTTQSESNNQGWNIYRSESEDITEGLQVNGEMITGAGTTTVQTSYTYADEFSVQTTTTVNYWLESVDYSGNSEFFGPISVTIEHQQDNPDAPEIPIVLGLHQNYPNPFNPDTKIKFAVEEAGKAEVAIFNGKGQKVITVFSGVVEAETYYECLWDGTDQNGKSVSSSLYFYQLKTEHATYLRKMLLIK